MITQQGQFAKSQRNAEGWDKNLAEILRVFEACRCRRQISDIERDYLYHHAHELQSKLNGYYINTEMLWEANSLATVVSRKHLARVATHPAKKEGA